MTPDKSPRPLVQTIIIGSVSPLATMSLSEFKAYLARHVACAQYRAMAQEEEISFRSII